MKSSKYVIDLKDFLEDKKTVEFYIRDYLHFPNLLLSEEGFQGDFHIHLLVSWVEEKILLSGPIEGEVETTCVRCADPALFHLQTSFTIPVVRVTKDQEMDLEDDEVIHLENNLLDVEQIIRENIILSVPLSVLCKEDCLGLCSVCGQNRNLGQCVCEGETTDIRMEEFQEKLSRLLKEMVVKEESGSTKKEDVQVSKK
jgi:uncharacterized protein